MSRKQGRFEQIGRTLGAATDVKNEAYGDAVNKTARILEILYPEGIPTAAYKDALLVTRVCDKLCRIATDRDAFGENPWNDIAGYGIRASADIATPVSTAFCPDCGHALDVHDVLGCLAADCKCEIHK